MFLSAESDLNVCWTTFGGFCAIFFVVVTVVVVLFVFHFHALGLTNSVMKRCFAEVAHADPDETKALAQTGRISRTGAEGKIRRSSVKRQFTNANYVANPRKHHILT